MQTYYAKSIFSSRTFWINVAMFVLAALELNEVTQLVPEHRNGLLGAVIALVNLALRFGTVRPVAFISPGDVKPVPVPSISATVQ